MIKKEKKKKRSESSKRGPNAAEIGVEKKKKGKRIKLSGRITQHTRVLSHLRAAHLSCNTGTDTKKHLCVSPAHRVGL